MLEWNMQRISVSDRDDAERIAMKVVNIVGDRLGYP